MANAARKKAWSPKCKTGCLTCRTRRVKCGEEKPECLRCTKLGRKCDWYDPDRPEMSSTGLARRASAGSSPTASSIASPTASIIATSSAIIEKDEKETRSLNFFINNTAPELAGDFKSRFWNSLVLQRCHSDPPIRHAVIALGAFHEFFKFGDKKLLEAGAIDDPK